jgi:hypothetical protein
MADGNGKTADMSIPPMAPSEYVDFIIGGTQIRVRALTLFDLERTKPYIQALVPGDWIGYASNIVSMIAELTAPSDGVGEPEATRIKLSRACSASEAMGLAATLNELFAKSGLITGEAEATRENSGIGTLTPSSPSLPSGESAVETPSPSSEPSP